MATNLQQLWFIWKKKSNFGFFFDDKIITLFEKSFRSPSRVNISFILTSMTRSTVYSAPHANPPFEQNFFLSLFRKERERSCSWSGMLADGCIMGNWLKPRSGQPKQTPDRGAKIYLNKSRARDWLTLTNSSVIRVKHTCQKGQPISSLQLKVTRKQKNFFTTGGIQFTNYFDY
jgi:hypothetical protein